MSKVLNEMRKYDQQGTPFKQNVADLRDAILSRPRSDGRGWLGAVSHEGLNVLVEAVRAYPKVSVLITLVFVVVSAEWAATGTFL